MMNLMASKKIFFAVITLLSILHVNASQDLALINTSGVAEKYIEPNLVIISIEAFGRSEFAKMAQEKQALEFQKLKKTIEKFKVKKEDFLTENISLTPEYKYDEKAQINRTVGFRVSHQLKIVLRQKEEAGSILDSLSSTAKSDSSGVTINSISWDFDKRKTMTEDLIQEAVADAKQKAERLAKAAGVRLKAVQTINYSDVSVNMPTTERFMSKAMSADFSRSTSTELAGGSIKLRTEVNVQYRIE